MQKSIFKKYFRICATLITVCIVVLGVVLMLFSFQYVKSEKYELLESSVKKADTMTAALAYDDLSTAASNVYLQSYCEVLSSAVDSSLFLVDLDGRVLYCTETKPCTHTDKVLSVSLLKSILESPDHTYREMGLLGGIYSEHHYTVAKLIQTDDEKPLGYVFSSMESTVPLKSFMEDILRMYLMAAIGVFLMSMVIIYFVTEQMVRPLREMATAAQEFGNGDFSRRLSVDVYDEVGQLAMALNNMAQSLSTLETTRRSFVANVSHELKTPMTTIGGFIDGILDGTIPPSQQNHYLRIVSDEVKRLSRLVRSMLNLSRIEAGEMELNLESFDMIDTICQVLFSLEGQINAKGLDVRGLDHEKVMVHADQELIHQVVYNLTENAIKFSNENGYLEFEFEKASGNSVMIGVKNSGMGLSKEEIPHVFDRFYKTDRSRGLDKNGVGLGLYIVRSIVHLHGGDIIVKSVQGEYCEFLFTLQLSKNTSKIRKPKETKE